MPEQSIAQRARAFPCRTCDARPGEFCQTSAGHKSYSVHLSRLEQENDAWLAEHSKREDENHARDPR